MSRINSRQKGAAGERELRDLFKSFGFDARRTQQYSGTEGTSDVTVAGLPTIHVESKRAEAFKGYDWVNQARRDAGDKIPVVFWRKSREDWLAIIPANILIPILQHLESTGYKP